MRLFAAQIGLWSGSQRRNVAPKRGRAASIASRVADHPAVARSVARQPARVSVAQSPHQLGASRPDVDRRRADHDQPDTLEGLLPGIVGRVALQVATSAPSYSPTSPASGSTRSPIPSSHPLGSLTTEAFTSGTGSPASRTQITRILLSGHEAASADASRATVRTLRRPGMRGVREDVRPQGSRSHHPEPSRRVRRDDPVLDACASGDVDHGPLGAGYPHPVDLDDVGARQPATVQHDQPGAGADPCARPDAHRDGQQLSCPGPAAAVEIGDAETVQCRPATDRSTCRQQGRNRFEADARRLHIGARLDVHPASHGRPAWPGDHVAAHSGVDQVAGASRPLSVRVRAWCASCR